MKVVRGDTAATSIERFESPARTGKISSFSMIDASIRAHEYVYATLDDIPHDMSHGNESTVIRQNNIDDRSELIMMDVGPLSTRHQKPIRTMEYYLKNVFDLRNGKEILARYCAFAFETPEQAQSFIKLNANAQRAQWWEEGYPYEPAPPGMEEESRKGLEAIERMKILLEKLQIEPPLNMEVRIQDYADIDRSIQ